MQKITVKSATLELSMLFYISVEAARFEFVDEFSPHHEAMIKHFESMAVETEWRAIIKVRMDNIPDRHTYISGTQPGKDSKEKIRERTIYVDSLAVNVSKLVEQLDSDFFTHFNMATVVKNTLVTDDVTKAVEVLESLARKIEATQKHCGGFIITANDVKGQLDEPYAQAI